MFGIVLFFFLTGSVRALDIGQTYCTNIFSNMYDGHNIVTTHFTANGATPFAGISELALLVVLMVLALLSGIYGIGIGFGINKLVMFAKTEYLESFFNLVIIAAIFGGMAALSGYSAFFVRLGELGSTVTPVAVPAHTAAFARNLYTDICTATIDNQVIPSLEGYALLLIQQPPYTLLSTASFTFGLLTGYLPSFEASPLGGLNIYLQLIILEVSPLMTLIFIGIAVIFLFYIIYFLFPIFLYAGILFRSFPWTRAAGGALLALFISFYMVFPALYYPFTVATYQPEVSLCGSPGHSSGFSAFSSIFHQYLCNGAVNFWSFLTGTLLPRIGSFIGAVLSPATGGGPALISNIDFFVYLISFSVEKLFGLGIAFIISFDLLEALGDMLGAPSLQSSRLFERMI